MSRYSRHFHARRAGDPKYVALAKATLAAYAAVWPGKRPETAVDVGSSIGALLAQLGQQGGIPFLTGLDHRVDKDLLVFKGTYLDFDLEGEDPGQLLANPSDLVVCQETLEHISPERTGAALAVLGWFRGPGTVLVFSAACPGQPGRHHVNCRPREEWIALLEAAGWRLHPGADGAYRAELKRAGISTRSCYYANTICLEG